MSLPPYLPYPPERYHGADGEVTARLRRADAPADLVYDSGVRVDYLATGATTGGNFGLYRWTFGPGETGPGPHFHRAVSESFYVLLGTVRIFDGREWVDVGAGDFVHVPPGGIHGFRNVADEPAAMLLHFSPGAPREGYFEGLHARRRGLELSEDELAEFYRAHDNHWVE